MCADLSLCYKCYESRTAFHATHHTFKQIGPEFSSASEAGSHSSSRLPEGTGSGRSDTGSSLVIDDVDADSELEDEDDDDDDNDDDDDDE